MGKQITITVDEDDIRNLIGRYKDYYKSNVSPLCDRVEQAIADGQPWDGTTVKGIVKGER